MDYGALIPSPRYSQTQGPPFPPPLTRCAPHFAQSSRNGRRRPAHIAQEGAGHRGSPPLVSCLSHLHLFKARLVV